MRCLLWPSYPQLHLRGYESAVEHVKEMVGPVADLDILVSG